MNNTLNQDFNTNLPQKIVNQSEFCSVQIIGDLLGLSLNNLDRLVTKPYGCGEQNMIILTPNIYALRYLNAVETASKKNNSNGKIANLILNAKENILYGYQNQLRYALDDGSFRYIDNQFFLVDIPGTLYNFNKIQTLYISHMSCS